jgi:hypothetical protein
MIAGRDIPPPDTTDLIPERVELPADSNAFTFFILATNSIIWPTNATFVTGYLDGKPVTDEVIQETISLNTNMMILVEKGLACQRCITPEVPNFTTLFTYLPPWRDMGRIMAIKAKHERLSGRYAEATLTCISLLRFGDMIQKDAESHMNYLVGLAVINYGFTQAEDLTHDNDIPLEELARLSGSLANLGPFDHGLVRAIKSENRMMADITDHIHDGELDSETLSNLDFDGFLPRQVWCSKWLPTYLFQPNNTKLAFANLSRSMIRNTGLPYSGMDFHETEGAITNFHMSTVITKPNGLGRLLYRLEVPALDAILEKRSREECILAATRIMVACKIYQKKEGKLPADLQSLVPLYLPSIPVDPFDGKPLRYSPSKGIVYSVGRDLKDSGGSARPRGENKEDFSPKRRWETEDAVYEINAPHQSQQH